MDIISAWNTEVALFRLMNAPAGSSSFQIPKTVPFGVLKARYKAMIKLLLRFVELGYCNLPGRDVFFIVSTETENGRNLLRFNRQWCLVVGHLWIHYI